MSDTTTPSPRPLPRWLIISFLVLSFIGFFDALYLTVQHYRGVVPACSNSGCDIVTTGKYAVLVGVPLALLGTLYYLTIFFLTVATLTTRRTAPFRFATYLTVLGFLFSLYLVWLQRFVIHAYCLYCLGSAATSTALFVLNFFVRNIPRSREQTSC